MQQSGGHFFTCPLGRSASSNPIAPNTHIKKRVAKATLFFMGWVMGFEPTNTGTTIRCLRPLGDTHHIRFTESAGLGRKMARQKGLEPLTYCLEGSCSIQLSYWRIFWSG